MVSAIAIYRIWTQVTSIDTYWYIIYLNKLLMNWYKLACLFCWKNSQVHYFFYKGNINCMEFDIYMNVFYCRIYCIYDMVITWNNINLCQQVCYCQVCTIPLPFRLLHYLMAINDTMLKLLLGSFGVVNIILHSYHSPPAIALTCTNTLYMLSIAILLLLLKCT